MNRECIIELAYDILRNSYPQKLSSSEVTDQILFHTGVALNIKRVREILKRMALTSKNFAMYYVRPRRIKFSVYI